MQPFQSGNEPKPMEDFFLASDMPENHTSKGKGRKNRKSEEKENMEKKKKLMVALLVLHWLLLTA